MNKLAFGLILPETQVNIYFTFDNKFWTYINYYRLAIKTATSFGYECHLYLNDNIVKYFEDLKVSLHIVNDLDLTFYDAINFYILKSSNKDALVLDGDIILNNKLPVIEADVVYEMKETHSWEWLYEFWVKESTLNNVKDIIPEWTGKKYNQIINIGAIQIQNKEFRDLYIKRWEDYRDFIKKNKHTLKYKVTPLDTVEYTTLASQYILTELAHYYDLNCVDLKPYRVYKHYVGNQKFTNNLVPYDRMLIFKQDSLI